MSLAHSILLSSAAMLMSISGTYLMLRISLRFNILDKPNPLIPQRTHAVPHLGGVGIFVSVALMLLILYTSRLYQATGNTFAAILPARIVLPSFLALWFGIADDIWNFAPLGKFSLQLVTATCAVSLGLIYSLTGYVFIDAVLSGFWILVLMNAFNLTDVCDGLVAGIGVTTFAAFSAYYPANRTLTLVLLGSMVGFLIFNAPPASIFLGETGSSFLGFIIAAITLSGSQGKNTWPYVPIMLLFTAVPLFELLFLVGVRIMKRLPWWKGSSDHFSLRLQAHGMSKRKVLATAWSASLTACVIALVIERVALVWQFLLIFIVIISSIWISFHLLRWEVNSVHTK
ncbi:MAG: undecaprenyl/decaprenyl-phosphate alpha-N-acetylglucosaminyl 1-phosphate transferase [candidate division WOR-3 bacterium]|nr:MAG: undecaprenyl/decaprenyl-phosphate alpha-N-acetylglucosaminyl 1-phosphate transferase [candidate division WOR-3 bacterium]